MNYYYDPEVAATLAAWVNYICPVEGAQQAMAKIDKCLVDNPLIFPDDGPLEDDLAVHGDSTRGTRTTMDDQVLRRRSERRAS